MLSDDFKVRTEQFEVLNASFQAAINEMDLALGCPVDLQLHRMGKDLVAHLRLWMAGRREEETISVPRDWWEHFKFRWFPRWALRRWPVKMRRIVTATYRVCPHLPIPATNGQPRDHVDFLIWGE